MRAGMPLMAVILLAIGIMPSSASFDCQMESITSYEGNKDCGGKVRQQPEIDGLPERFTVGFIEGQDACVEVYNLQMYGGESGAPPQRPRLKITSCNQDFLTMEYHDLSGCKGLKDGQPFQFKVRNGECQNIGTPSIYKWSNSKGKAAAAVKKEFKATCQDLSVKGQFYLDRTCNTEGRWDQAAQAVGGQPVTNLPARFQKGLDEGPGACIDVFDLEAAPYLKQSDRYFLKVMSCSEKELQYEFHVGKNCNGNALIGDSFKSGQCQDFGEKNGQKWTFSVKKASVNKFKKEQQAAAAALAEEEKSDFEKEYGMTEGAFAGMIIAISCVALIALIVVCLCYCRKKGDDKVQQYQQPPGQPVQNMQYVGQPQYVQPVVMGQPQVQMVGQPAYYGQTAGYAPVGQKLPNQM